ncbi:MAG: hypothetical protein JKX84_01915 [Flavobacteriales bacterium]|nr:hypothetical protein [Flavobacteriales bacterium]
MKIDFQHIESDASIMEQHERIQQGRISIRPYSTLCVHEKPAATFLCFSISLRENQPQHHPFASLHLCVKNQHQQYPFA